MVACHRCTLARWQLSATALPRNGITRQPFDCIPLAIEGTGLVKLLLKRHKPAMLHLVLKAAISGALVAAASTLAKRYPGFGALIASLPLVSVLGMMWLWNEKPDAANMAAHSSATFWYVLPSLPMFLVIPAMLRAGFHFWLALAIGCALTVVLYATMTAIAQRIGIQL